MILTHPWFMSLAALVVPLTLLFLFRRSRNVATVPSTLLWQRFAIANAKNRRFRSLARVLSFLLCVSAFLALALAAARPSRLGDHSLTIAIVDVSASMGSGDHSPLERARERLRSDARGLGTTARFALITAGDTAQVLIGPSNDEEAITRAIDRIEPTRGTANLSAAIRVARGFQDHSTTLRIFHDGNSTTRGATDTWNGEVEEVLLARSAEGTQRDNVGIVAFSARAPQDAVADEDRAVMIGITASGAESASGGGSTARESGLETRRVQVTLEDAETTLATREVDVTPGALADVTVRLQVFTPRLTATVRPIDGRDDALQRDDVAELEITETVSKRVILAHGAEDERRAFFVEAALRSAGVTELSRVAELPVPLPEGALAVVIGDAPSRVTGPVIYIASDTGAPFPTRDLTREELSLRAVDPEHALTRGVNLDGVTIASARALEIPTDAPRVRSLVELDGGTVLATGRAGGARFVYLGLDPTRSDVVLRVAFPVLLANAVQLLTGADEVTSFDAIPFDEVAITKTPSLNAVASQPGTRLPVHPAFFFAGLAICVLVVEGAGYGKGWLR